MLLAERRCREGGKYKDWELMFYGLESSTPCRRCVWTQQGLTAGAPATLPLHRVHRQLLPQSAAAPPAGAFQRPSSSFPDEKNAGLLGWFPYFFHEHQSE